MKAAPTGGRSLAARAAAMLATLMLAACGGGGGGGGSTTGTSNDTRRLDVGNAAAALGDSLGLAEAALAMVHVAQEHVDALARVGPLPRAVFCRGGNARASLVDRDGDGRPGAGDSIVVDHTRCGFGPLSATFQGRLQIDIDQISTDGLQLQARLSMPDGLDTAPGFPAGPTGRWSGRLAIELKSEAGRSTWIARASAADGLRFSWSGNPAGSDLVEALAVQRVLGHADARTQWTASLDVDSARRGLRYRLRTPVALAGPAGSFPDTESGRARLELGDSAGNTLVASPLDPANVAAAPQWQLELGTGTGSTVLPAADWYSLLNGLGLWSGLDEMRWPLRGATARELRFISRASGSQDMHRPLRLLLSRPLAAGTVPQFLLEDAGRLGTQQPAFGRAVPMVVDRDGLLLTLRPAELVPDSTRLQLHVSPDGIFPSPGPVLLKADDGSQLIVNGGVVAGFSTWDRLQPRIAGARARALLLAGSSIQLDGLSSMDPEWITAYRWSQVDGTPLHLGSPEFARTSVGVAGGAGVGYATVRLELRNAAGQLAREDLTLKTVQAGATAWMLYLAGQQGDFIVGDRIDYFSEQIGSFAIDLGVRPGSVRIRYSEGVVSDWTLTLGRADGAPLEVGVYEGARSATAGAPVLDLSGEGRACGGAEGRFEVLEIARDSAGNIVRLAVDFEQRCTGGSAGLVGALRHASTRPLPGAAQPPAR